MVGNNKDELLRIFPARLRPLLAQAAWNIQELEEIRIRVGQPMIFCYGGRECFFSLRPPYLTAANAEPYRFASSDLKEMLNYMCSFSLYAYAKDLQQGFLTLPGGNRVGVCGEMAEADRDVRAMEYPGFFDIRIAHERKGCAGDYMAYIRKGGSIYHTLILSAPGVGKTTFLRDCIRLLGQPASGVRSIGVVDERYEIAASVHGVPQNDLGMRSDILSGCNKQKGMELMLRTMGPEIIAVDEIGGREEERTLRRMVYSGVKVLATAHAADLDELRSQSERAFTAEIFQRFVVLGRGENGNRRVHIYDGKGGRLC